VCARARVCVCVCVSDPLPLISFGYKPHESSWRAGTVPCILTYDGDPQPLAINYTVLVVLLIVAAAELAAQRPGAKRGEVTRRAAWQLAGLMFLVGLQVCVCVFVDLTGISIIWNAVSSFLLLQRQRARLEYQHQQPKRVEVIEPHDLHYLRAADTTINVAHGCALLLGVGLEHQYARLFKKSPAPEPEPEPEPAKRRKHHPREYVIVDESVELP
jgi:hypothetical protein